MNALTEKILGDYRETEDLMDRAAAERGEEIIVEVMAEAGINMTLAEFREKLSDAIAKIEVGALWCEIGPNEEQIFRCE